MKKKPICLLVYLLLSNTHIALCAEKSNLPTGVVATVNGASIKESRLIQIVKDNVSQGRADTPELRKAIIDELVARELFVQAAVSQGLDKSADYQDKLRQLQQNLLISALETDALNKTPLTEAEYKAEYDRQVAALANAKEYQIKQIVVATEAEATAAIDLLNKGKAFEKVAKEKSLDISKENGGNVGWIVSNQLIQAVASAISGLNKGAVTKQPIFTGNGWHIIKLEDIRPYKAPSFEESKQLLAPAIVQNRRQALLAKLRASAKIVQ